MDKFTYKKEINEFNEKLNKKLKELIKLYGYFILNSALKIANVYF